MSAGKKQKRATMRTVTAVTTSPAPTEGEARVHQLEALRALTDTALTHLELEDLLEHLLQHVQEIMQVDHAAILLLDTEHKELRIRAVRGFGASIAEHAPVPLGKGFAGRIAASQTPLIVEDLSTFPLVNAYLQDRLQTLLGVPLLVADRVVGVLQMGTAHPTYFTQEDITLLQRVAGRIALAVDRTLLYAETERARTEATLRAQQLETLYATLVDGLIMFDGQGQLLHMNPAARTLLGLPRQPEYSLAEAAGRLSPYDLRDEQNHPLPFDRWPVTRILQGETLRDTSAVDVRLVNRDGQERDLNISGAPVRDQAGQPIGAVVVLHDVTERRKLARRTQEALEAVLTMAETLVTGPGSQEAPIEDAKTVARQLADLTCRVLNCQRVGIALLDPATDLLKPLAVAGLTPEQEAQWWKEQESQQVPLHQSPETEMVAQLEAGDVIQLDLTRPPYRDLPNPYGITTMLAVPLRLEQRLVGVLTLDHAGEAHVYSLEEQRLAQAVAQLVTMVVDRERLLRERAEAEARALAWKDANQRLETFIGIVSHELRTPVAALLANLQIVLRRFQNATDADWTTDRRNQMLERLRRVDQQVRRLTRLINDMIDLARIRTGKLDIGLEPGDLGSILIDTVRTEQAGYQERLIQLDLPATPVPALIDPDRIGQVISNYLTNALKYSPAQAPVSVGLQLEEGWARVWVRDQGPGIPAEEQSRIWEPFHRVAEIAVQSGSGVGLGLGLHISKTLIEQQGGHVGVESDVGAGSTFWFTLPLIEAEPRESY